jgi:hypothetical protein
MYAHLIDLLSAHEQLPAEVLVEDEVSQFQFAFVMLPNSGTRLACEARIKRIKFIRFARLHRKHGIEILSYRELAGGICPST